MTNPIPDQDERLLAITMLGEARNQGAGGMTAVAWVIRNRRDDPSHRWPATIAAVCLQPKQFSCWNLGDPNGEYIRQLREDGYHAPEYLQAAVIAKSVLLGTIPDPTGGATHYLTTKLYRNSRARPKWADALEVTTTLGDHVFLKDRT